MIPTASGIELARRCPGSLTIPHRHEDNEYSRRGNDDHKDLEDDINAGNIPDAYLERWPEATTWRAEVAYAYDVSCDNGREIGVGLKRAYGNRSPFETFGTIDVEGRGPGILVVIDRKGYERQTPAARHPQVRFLALAAARALPAERVEVAIDAKIGDLDVAHLDPAFDLDVIAHETRRFLVESAKIIGEAREGKPIDFNIGRWCRWCNAFDACPKQDELRDLARLDEGHPKLDLVHYQDLPDQYELMLRVGILYKRLKSTVYGAASQAPIKLRSGKIFGPVVTEGNRTYDGARVHAAVAAHPLLGREVADKAVEMVASQAQFKRVVQPLAPKRGFSKLKDEIFNQVEADGGMTRKPSVEYVEHDP